MSQAVTGETGVPNELAKPATQDQKWHYFAIFQVVVTAWVTFRSVLLEPQTVSDTPVRVDELVLIVHQK